MNMDTASIQFVLYGLAAAVLSNLNRSRVWRSIVLSAASIAFLALLDRNPIHFIPLAGFLLLGYAGLFLIQRGMHKVTVLSILAVILAYIWLKKYTLLPDASFIHSFYFTVGLSYIFFRVLHLIIEAGDSKDKPRIGLGAYLLYTLNFTTLVSGPIQRYDEFARDQFAEEPIPLGIRDVGLQLERIIRGFFKVNVLAMLLNFAREDAYIQLTHPMPMQLKLYATLRLIVIYPIFLYANFSGYIDIVIAVARLMRVRLPENFDRPFSASSFIDFWNRWHITLSTWLKTYVYNPLLVALMRRFTSPSIEPVLGVFSFFVTFFLVGLWHGRTSEFITFGILQGGRCNKQGLAVVAHARTGPERLQGAGGKSCLHCCRSRPHIQLVCIYALLVLGRVGGDQDGCGLAECVAMARRVDGGLRQRNGGVCSLGEGAGVAVGDQNRWGPDTDQPLRARGLRVGARLCGFRVHHSA